MAINDSNGQNGPMNSEGFAAESLKVQAAVRNALRQVRILHKKMGVPLVGSVKGKFVSIPPDQIQIDIPPDRTPDATQ